VAGADVTRQRIGIIAAVDFVAALRMVVGALERRQVPVALVGGLALHAYGVGRATFDVDVVTLRSAQRHLVAFLESRGYQTLHTSPGYSNHLHADAAFGRIDVVYVDEGTAAKLFEPATRREILPGVSILVPRPEHLIAMKVRALANDPRRRLQDMADIQRLLTLPEVDRAEARGYFARLGLEEWYDEIAETL
jgi:hypothetical protein